MSLSAWAGFSLLDLAIIASGRWNLRVVSIYIFSLMTKDIEHSSASDFLFSEFSS